MTLAQGKDRLDGQGCPHERAGSPNTPATPQVLESVHIEDARGGGAASPHQRGDLVALEVEDGRFRWETTQLLGLSEHDPAIDITPVAEPDGSMYSGSYSGVLYHHRFRPQADPLAAPVETTAAPALARRVSGLVGRVAGDGPGSSTADGWPSLAVDHLDLAHLAVHLEGNDRHLAMVAPHAEAIAPVTQPAAPPATRRTQTPARSQTLPAAAAPARGRPRQQTRSGP